MTIYLNVQNISKSFGTQTLFSDLSFSLFKGDRVALIGPNGAGKSTLVKILAHEEFPDRGEIVSKKYLKIGYVPQRNEFEDKPLLEVVLHHFSSECLLPEYERVIIAETLLSKLGFSGKESTSKTLSGGWRKRLAIACALVETPDLLLLDEPTNHLDLEGILWLENFLLKEVETFLIITHDRTFLNHIATKVIEINPVYPKGLFEVSGSYDQFLVHRELFLQRQEEEERVAKGRAKRETDWLRTSPKARTTKAESRIMRAEEAAREHKDLESRNKERRVGIEFTPSLRQTEKLLVGKNLKYEVGGKVLFEHLDLTLTKGMRLGLMGPNGSGKTTLLRLLAGEISPAQGTIKRADDLKIVVFDQHRAKLPLHITLKEALSPNSDHVLFQGRPVHVNGWCKRFLFSPETLSMPISQLSGGERARIAIANLMLESGDILFLDEPTNDLDIPTLEMLEESLKAFPGAVVLITHDRALLENICTTFLALGSGEELEYFAEYAQWERKQKHEEPLEKPEKKASLPPPLKKESKRAVEKIQEKIAQKEGEIARLTEHLNTPEVQNDQEKLLKVCSQIAALEHEIEILFAEWEAL